MELPGGRRLVRDKVYGFLKVMPRPSGEEIASFYANAYRNPCVLHDPEGRADIVCEFVPQPGRILDIGCGRGELLEVFMHRGWEVMGIEPNKEYALAARSRDIPVVEDVLTEQILEKLGSFDAVLLAHVLEHLARPEEMVSMVRRLLVNGGVFYCEVPNDFNALQEVAVSVHNLRPWWIALPDHLNYFTIKSLSAFIGGQGFDVVLETTDFPVELFLLWGDIYIDNPEKGSWMHGKRCRFEEAMRKAGKNKLLRDLYEAMAKIGIVCKKARLGCR
jgi:SAM-dependent methyltransferase